MQRSDAGAFSQRGSARNVSACLSASQNDVKACRLLALSDGDQLVHQTVTDDNVCSRECPQVLTIVPQTHSSN